MLTRHKVTMWDNILSLFEQFQSVRYWIYTKRYETANILSQERSVEHRNFETL